MRQPSKSVRSIWRTGSDQTTRRLRQPVARSHSVRPVPPVCMDIGIGLRVKNVSVKTDIFQSRKIVADLIVSMAVWRDMVVRMYLRFPAGIATPSPTGRVATGLPANSSNTAT